MITGGFALLNVCLLMFTFQLRFIELKIFLLNFNYKKMKTNEDNEVTLGKP